MSSVVSLGNEVYMIDIFDQNEKGRTCCYLVNAEKVAFIETGATPGSGYLKEALQDLGIAPEKVAYIIVTHIHLDHSGGSGVLARDLPNAKVVVHPRGSKHLIDPSRIIAGAKALYKDSFDTLFGEILPVPEDRVHIPGDGEVIDLGGGRQLTIYHTEGHARHHLVAHDPSSRGVFSGDALGVRFNAISELVGFDYTVPSTPPTEFDYDATLGTIDRMAGLGLEQIYFTHYGRSKAAAAVMARNRELIQLYVENARRVLEAGGGWQEVEAELWKILMDELAKYGLTDRQHPAVKYTELDMSLNAQGIVLYLEKLKKSQQ